MKRRSKIDLVTRLSVWSLALMAVPDLSLAGGFAAPPVEEFLMDRQLEIALARSAAPAQVSNEATILVLGRDGYSTAVEGKNRFVCLVLRSWGNPDWSEEYAYMPGIIVPECLDERAQETILPIQLYRAELGTQGTHPMEIRDRVVEGFRTGRFKRTKSVSFSYMMSAAMTLADGTPLKPHVMIYLPDDYRNDMLGGFGYRDGFVIIEGGPDQPFVAANVYRPEMAIEPVRPD